MALVIKNLIIDAGDIRDTGLIPELGRSLEEEHANPHANPTPPVFLPGEYHGRSSLVGYSS